MTFLIRNTRCLARRLADGRGQTMAEYAIVLSVISVGVMAAFAALSGALGTVIQGVIDIF